MGGADVNNDGGGKKEPLVPEGCPNFSTPGRPTLDHSQRDLIFYVSAAPGDKHRSFSRGGEIAGRSG